MLYNFNIFYFTWVWLFYCHCCLSSCGKCAVRVRSWIWSSVDAIRCRWSAVKFSYLFYHT